MKSLENTYFTYLSGNDEVIKVTNTESFTQPSMDSGNVITSYPELLRKIANIRYENPSYDIFFRSQEHKDYLVNANGNDGRSSSLYPSIFRNKSNHITNAEVVRKRYEVLDAASKSFMENANGNIDYNYLGIFKRNPTLIWAILQHYEVCDTPFLDVTPSLQVALSFCITRDNNRIKAEEAAIDLEGCGYLYLIGMPRQTEIITTSVASQVKCINLTQCFPPIFLRPHFQTGYLIGEYPDVVSYSKALRGEDRTVYNFSKRLLAKFKIENKELLVNTGFTPTDDSILRPRKGDKLLPIITKVKNDISDLKDELWSLVESKKR